MNLNLGYVKIVSGVSNGRIGRYVSDDLETGKAKIYFGYHNDALKFENYRNCIKIAKTSITNDISKRDLIDRYFNIVQLLDSVDLNSNRSIKKYSAGHTDIITECNIIRALLRERFSPMLLNSSNAQKNTLLLSSFKDSIWINDFAVELEERGFNVALDDHETWAVDKRNFLKDSLGICYTFIFVASKNSIRSAWLKDELCNLRSYANTGSHKIICVRIDDVRIPSYIGQTYDFSSQQFSDKYNHIFSELAEFLHE